MLELRVNIDGNDKFLLVRDELPESNQGHARHELHAPVATNLFPDETPFEALQRLCVQRLGLTHDVCLQQFLVENYSFTETLEESSLNFPGLMTMHQVHKLVVHLQDAHAPDFMCIGLPKGDEFAVDFSLTMDNAYAYTIFFMWVSREEFDESVLQWYGKEQTNQIDYVERNCKSGIVSADEKGADFENLNS